MDEHGNDRLEQTFEDHIVAIVVLDEWLHRGRHRNLRIVEAAGDDADG